MQKVIFNPTRDGPESFQVAVRITGELGNRARAATKRFGLSNHGLVEQCIKFALDNMEENQ